VLRCRCGVPSQADKVREEFHRVLKDPQSWKGDVWVLQVTDATERTMQLRAIMDATDSSSAWDELFEANGSAQSSHYYKKG
jgi:hypothetical protein